MQNKAKKGVGERQVLRHGLVITAILLVIAGAMAGIRYRRGVTQKRDFDSAVSRIERLKDIFVVELGEPIYQSKEESCQYNNRSELGLDSGRLDCTVSFSVWNPVTNGSVAKDRTASLQNITVVQYPTMAWSSSVPGSNFNTGDDPYQNLARTDFSSTGSVLCDVTYKYAIPETFNEISFPASHSIGNNSGVLEIRMICSTSPPRPFFPVTEE